MITTGSVCGSRPCGSIYLFPKVARSFGDIDTANDLFTLGGATLGKYTNRVSPEQIGNRLLRRERGPDPDHTWAQRKEGGTPLTGFFLPPPPPPSPRKFLKKLIFFYFAKWPVLLKFLFNFYPSLSGEKTVPMYGPDGKKFLLVYRHSFSSDTCSFIL